MAFDKHHTHHVPVVARDKYCVLSHEHPNLRLSRNLTESDRLEHDGPPTIVADP